VLTPEQVQTFAPKCSAATAQALIDRVNELGAQYGLTTVLRLSHFMGQTHHESGGFTVFVENLNYSAQRIPQVWPRLASRAAELARNPQRLANAAYAGRIGNGDEASGDGWRYRGRGIIQLTGRANYRERGDAVGIDLEGSPNRASWPDIAVELALSFWKAKRCNEAADSGDVAKVTKIINGGVVGLADRTAQTDRALIIFNGAV